MSPYHPPDSPPQPLIVLFALLVILFALLFVGGCAPTNNGEQSQQMSEWAKRFSDEGWVPLGLGVHTRTFEFDGVPCVALTNGVDAVALSCHWRDTQ